MSTPRHGDTHAPIETKVQWATAASYIAALFLTALANGLQNEDHALILGTIPEWLESILLPLLPALATFAAGWAAKHTHRPDLWPKPTSNPTL